MDNTHLLARIAELTAQLERASAELHEWQAAGRALAQNAALARAENQGAGRGLGGMLFGATYRAAARRAAAASNATVAKEVAQKRAAIAQGKARAQTQIRELKATLAAVRQEQRQEAGRARAGTKARAHLSTSVSKELVLLSKLKKAHTLGLLTDSEFEQKKRQLLRLP